MHKRGSWRAGKQSKSQEGLFLILRANPVTWNRREQSLDSGAFSPCLWRALEQPREPHFSGRLCSCDSLSSERPRVNMAPFCALCPNQAPPPCSPSSCRPTCPFVPTPVPQSHELSPSGYSVPGPGAQLPAPWEGSS